MQIQAHYSSPLGKLLLTANEHALLEARFDVPPTLPGGASPILEASIVWLNRYFSGKDPGKLPPLCPEGTLFQQCIWRLMLNIPYGYTTSYGMLARQAAVEMGKARMSAQAVGGAIRRNPISIFIPCHRVVGHDGNLTGYFGGMERKIQLLTLEGQDMTKFSLPKK